MIQYSNILYLCRIIRIIYYAERLPPVGRRTQVRFTDRSIKLTKSDVQINGIKYILPSFKNKMLHLRKK